MTASQLQDAIGIGGVIVGAIIAHAAHTRVGKAVEAEAERIHSWYKKHIPLAARQAIDQAAQDALQGLATKTASLDVRVTHLESLHAAPGGAQASSGTSDPAKGA